MTTATFTQQAAAPAELAPVPMDFDTRLMLRGIQMDVTLSGMDGVTEAHAAAIDALAGAGTYSDQLKRWQPVTAAPEAVRGAGVLRQAAHLIRANGWCQNDWTAEDGAMCLMTAIRVASAGNDSLAASAEMLVLERIRIQFGTGYRSQAVPYWNDQPGRTEDQVLSLLW